MCVSAFRKGKLRDGAVSKAAILYHAEATNISSWVSQVEEVCWHDRTSLNTLHVPFI
jgi:hypothetical protein